MIHGVSPPGFSPGGSSRIGRLGLSKPQQTCVGGKITPVDPQFGDDLDAVGDSDG